MSTYTNQSVGAYWRAPHKVVKRGCIVAILIVSTSILALSQERKVLSGFLVDKRCASFYATSQEKLPDHSKGCVLACAAEAGFGLLREDGFVPFGEEGNKLAREWLEKTSKEKDLQVRVTFTVDADQLKVEKIE